MKTIIQYYEPYINIEYEYNPHVRKGSIRYFSQNVDSDFFYEEYWPSESFGEYYGPKYESGTACCCMALNYLGINETPESMLRKHNGLTVWSDWGTEYLAWRPDGTVATMDIFQDRILKLVNGNGEYSPVMIHVKGGTWSERGHYFLIIGRKSDKEFLALDPTNMENRILLELTIENLAITGNDAGKPICPIDEIHQWFFCGDNYYLDVIEKSESDITASCKLSESGLHNYRMLKDGCINYSFASEGNTHISIENEIGIGGIYLIFDLEYGDYTIMDDDTGEKRTVGQFEYLHDYLNLLLLFGRSLHSVTLIFEKGPVSLRRIQVFSEDEIPNTVQMWEPPLDGCADMALFSTHGDDEQLFFAGLLPLYAGERNVAVQVIYLTNHRNITNVRIHEMLNGLWAVGVRHYPVFGRFEDFCIEDLEKTYVHYEELGTSRNELLQFVVTQIRRFRPQVAVGHDLKGEYNHGMHMLYADLLTKAYEISDDENAFPEIAQKYGIWHIPKLFLHLYDKNRIVMDYDRPLEKFGGLTAFQVTQKKGFPCHKSQQWTWFKSWLYGKENNVEKATQIETYSPCCFGLYNASSSMENKTNDMMENVIPYVKHL